MSGFKFISICGGIGGFDLALTRNYWKCAAYYEIDKYCCQIYNSHFNTNYKPTDITTLDVNTIPEHDLLVAGFPCQPFSIAGERKGFDDTRGTIFFNIAKIIECKKPNYILLENVKGLVNHQKGETFSRILETLWELGYDYQWQILNSCNFEIPHNRERIFIFCTKRNSSSPPRIFPIQIKTINKLPRRELSQGIRLSSTKNGNIRLLTHNECEKIMGFPNNWTKSVSNTQRYKQLGNSVDVRIVEFIIKKLNNEIKYYVE